jgi:hypothetical protein
MTLRPIAAVQWIRTASQSNDGGHSMETAVIRFPVSCPCCGQESLAVSSFDSILDTLATEGRLKLSSDCAHHRAVWVANEIERDQIREYAAAMQLSRNGRRQAGRFRFYRWRTGLGRLPPP